MHTSRARIAFVLAALFGLFVFGATAHAQGALTNGAHSTGLISPAGDADTWTFSANAGDAIVIRVGELISGSALTPRIRLFRPDNAQIDVSYSGAGAEVQVTAPSTGTYTAIVDDVTAAPATGGYEITLVKTGSPVVVSGGDQGGPLTNGALHTGTLSVGDLDAWTVDATAGDAIVVRMGETVSGSALTPELRIFTPTGTQAAYSYTATAGEVQITAPVTGQYVVLASDASGGFVGSGDYRLTLVKTGSPVVVSGGDEGGPLTNDAMNTGTLSVGDLDAWTVDATAGDAIVVRIGETVTGSTLTPEVRIFTPTGTQADYSYSATGGEVQINAPVTGQYIVVASDASGGYAGSGDYRLTMVKTGSPVVVSASDEGGPLTNGAMNTGTLSVGDLDAWTVDATAGDAIVVRIGETVTGSALTPEVRIFTPTGTQADYSYSATAGEVQINAPVTGQYVIVAGDVSAGFAGAGDYRLTLVKSGSPVTVSPGDEGGPMTNGALHTGTASVGDLDAWTVDATAGDAIVVRMGETLAGGALTPELRIFSPTGTQVDYHYTATAAEVAITASVTGQYVVIASDVSAGFAGAGDYRLTLSRTSTPVTTSQGDQGGPLFSGVGAGSIETGDLDLWTFSANAGASISLAMEEIVSGSSLTPYLRLYSPAGALIKTASNASRATVTVTAPATGTYLLLACDNSSAYAGTGTYRIIPSATTDATTAADAPASLALAAPAPNPFLARTVLRYALPRASAVTLRVFDAQGRVVRTLVDDAMKPAGRYESTWNGSDEQGRAAQAGVYFARLASAGRTEVQKLMLSR